MPGARNETRATMLAEEVEHARSFRARFMGLMGRAALAPGHALWLRGNGIHMFFMRFPSDAVFLSAALPNGARRVVSTHREVRPWVGMVPLVRGAAASGRWAIPRLHRLYRRRHGHQGVGGSPPRSRPA